jgi:hypothetical protein
MKRIEAAREIVSRKIASRPMRVAVAVKIAFAILGANVSLAAAKVYFAKPQAAPVAVDRISSVTPFIVPIAARPEADVAAANAQSCHEVVVRIDDGYGVRGEVVRTVCRKAL